MADYEFTGPYIENEDTVEKNMLQVVLALLPALVAAVIFFGIYSFYLALGTALFSTIIEYPFAAKSFSWKKPLGDGSAFLAGFLLGLTLPPAAPWWIPPAGAFFTIVLGKQIFGGLGNNIFNPALVGRAVLLLCWLEPMTAWRKPFDGLTAATPLAQMLAEGGETAVEYTQLFLGNISGSIGETSALALLLGALYLYVKGYISWRIPGGYIMSAGLLSYFLGLAPLYSVLSGGLLFGALFMASDMVTSPVTRDARLVYGIGCGVFTVLIRQFTIYPEGVTFAILLMNGAAYLLDTVLEGPRFGEIKRRKKHLKMIGSLILISLFFLGMGRGASYLVENYFVEEERLVVDGTYQGTGKGGYGEISVEVVVENSKIQTITVTEHEDTERIAEPAFKQLGELIVSSQNREVDTVSGATLSSRGYLEAVENALAGSKKTGVEVFMGTGTGMNEEIIVEVTVGDNEIKDILVKDHADTENLAEPAFAELREKILSRQSLEVDSVTGATVSSQGYLAAVEQALEEAGVEIESQNIDSKQRPEEIDEEEVEIDVTTGATEPAGQDTDEEEGD